MNGISDLEMYRRTSKSVKELKEILRENFFGAVVQTLHGYIDQTGDHREMQGTTENPRRVSYKFRKKASEMLSRNC